MIDDSPLLSPDTLLPSQWSDIHGRVDNEQVKNLLRAILEISLRDATGQRSTKGGGRRRKYKSTASQREHAAMKQSGRASALRREALDWIFDDGGDGVFSFRNVCDTLGIDSARLRERLIGKRAAERQAA